MKNKNMYGKEVYSLIFSFRVKYHEIISKEIYNILLNKIVLGYYFNKEISLGVYNTAVLIKDELKKKYD